MNGFRCKKRLSCDFMISVSQQATVEVCRIAQMPLKVTEVRKSFLAGVHTTARFSSGKITLILGNE